MVVGTPDHIEETEDTDSLGEQPECIQMAPPQMPVHNTDSMENRLISAENHCLVHGCHMSQERHKTPKKPKKHEKMTSSEKTKLDKFPLLLCHVQSVLKNSASCDGEDKHRVYRKHIKLQYF